MLSLLLQAIPTFNTTSSSFQSTNTLGTAFFWIGFGFFVTTAGLFLLSAIIARSDKVRSFSVGNLTIVGIAATAYFAMAIGQGYNINPMTGRYNYWVRYIDWFFTTPLILLDVANLCGASNNLTAMLVIFDVFMIVTGLFGSLSIGNSGRWGWFSLGCVAFMPVLWLILFDFQRYIKVRPEINRAYQTQVWYLAILWILYPIVWGLGTGAQVISTDAETVWITILDILAKAVFGSILLGLFREVLPFGEGLLADHPSNLPRHAEYDERDLEAIDPATKQPYIVRGVHSHNSSPAVSQNAAANQNAAASQDAAAYAK